jgi:DNA primase
MKDLSSLIDFIKENVSLKDILVRKGKIRGTLPEEQFSCMFHGADRKKSSRYYKETDTAYCWVCKKKWDVISFIQEMEGMTFPQALKYIVGAYNLDTSRLPDTPEAEVKRITAREKVRIDDRKLSIEKLSQAIASVRDELPPETYDKIVHSFMVLKYQVSDEKFQEMFCKLRDAMLRVFEKASAEMKRG